MVLCNHKENREPKKGGNVVNMIKLWKVTCNGIGWSGPATYYFKSRSTAEEFHLIMKGFDYIVSDGVKYAGNFEESKACDLYERSRYEADEILRRY